MQYQEGQPLRGPNGENGVFHNGHIVVISPQSPPSVQMHPADPMLAVHRREATANASAAESNAISAANRAAQATAEMHARSSPMIDPNLTGPAALEAMSPGDRRMVQAMVDGRVVLPTSNRVATDANWQRWLALAQQVDPQLNQNTIRNIQHAQQSWLTGPDHRNVQSLSTALEHVDGLQQAITNLNNFNNLPGPLNNVANSYENAMYGAGSRAAALNDFRTRAHTVAGEVATAVKGGQATIDDIRGYESQLNPNMSPDALNATVNAMTDQISARIRESRDAYRTAMGRPDINLPLISPTAAQILADRGQGDLVDHNLLAQPGSAAPPGERMDPTRLTIGDQQGDPGMHLSATEQADPARAAYNTQLDRHVSQMLHSGASDSAIQAFGAENQLNPDYTASVLAWRRGIPVPGARGTFRQWHHEHPGGLLPLEDMAPNVPLTGPARLVAGGAASWPGTFVTHAANGVVPLALDARLAGGDPNQVNMALEAQQQAHPLAAFGGQLAGTAAAYYGGGKLFGMAGRALLRPGEEAAATLAAQEAGAGRAAAGDIAGAEAPAAAVPSVNAPAPTIQQRIGKLLVGTPGPMTPINARGMIGDALYGGIQGSGDGDPLTGAVASMGGGMGGRAAGRVIGTAARGATDAATRYLTARDIPLTVGQILGQGGRIGQFVRGIENRFSGINPMIDNQYRQGIGAFNRQAFNDSVAPIGGAAPGQVGERGLENVRGQRSDAYNSALDGQSFTGDQAFSDQMHTLIRDGRSIPGLGDQFNHIINTRIAPMFTPDGTISGSNFQAALQGIRRARTEFAGQPLGYDFGQALTGVEDALTGLVQRQAPEVMPALNAANATNRQVSILGDAVRKGQANVQDGAPLFTPFQLNQSSIANTTRYGGREAATSTSRPFFDLTRNAQEVLPNRVPDTGSGSRAWVPVVTGAALGGLGAGADYSGATDNSTRNGLIIAGILSGAHANIGRATIQSLLVKRPDLLRQFGEDFLNGPGPGILGAGGAGTAAYESTGN